MNSAPSVVDIPTDSRPGSPYKGLLPYGVDDRPWFFGRDDEREVIVANVLASRLTVVYGASGVGKTSLLRAGVVSDLRDRASRHQTKAGTPDLVVVLFDVWQDDPTPALIDAVRDAVGAALGSSARKSVPANASLGAAVAAASAPFPGRLLLLLDQFEEYFLYRDRSTGASFDAQLAHVVNDRELGAHVVMSLRDDALAALDRLEPLIPAMFENCVRIDHLTHKAARAAIEQPLAHYNALLSEGEEPVTIEPDAVELVLRQVTGELHGGLAGLGASPTPAKDRVEAPYLQLVMTRLWAEESRAGSSVLRLATLEGLGGAQQIVRTHLDDALSGLSRRQQDVAAEAFRYLVTPSGAKIAHVLSDLAEYGHLSEAELEPVLDCLSQPGLRILRPVPPPTDLPDAKRFQIFHDVLTTPVLDWRVRHLRAVEQRRATRVRRALFVASVVLALVVASAALVISGNRDAVRRAELAPFGPHEKVFLDGFGPVVLGSTPGMVNGDLSTHGKTPVSFPQSISECRPFALPESPKGVTYALADGVVQRIAFDTQARVTTLRGARIGTTIGDLQRIYGANLSTQNGLSVYRATSGYENKRLIFRLDGQPSPRVVGFWNELVDPVTQETRCPPPT